jgi:hypothetical protein
MRTIFNGVTKLESVAYAIVVISGVAMIGFGGVLALN